MKINELFKKIEDNFSSEELCGDVTLQKKSIVWTYKLDEDCEELEDFYSADDDEFQFDFESESSEELLIDAYISDLKKIEDYLDEIEEDGNWTFSDSTISNNVISFKIS